VYLYFLVYLLPTCLFRRYSTEPIVCNPLGLNFRPSTGARLVRIGVSGVQVGKQNPAARRRLLSGGVNLDCLNTATEAAGLGLEGMGSGVDGATEQRFSAARIWVAGQAISTSKDEPGYHLVLRNIGDDDHFRFKSKVWQAQRASDLVSELQVQPVYKVF
jgi:hypothetical protein